jgi:hypothetical protein
MSQQVSRRYFLMGGAAVLAAPALEARPASLKRQGYKSPNEKLNIVLMAAKKEAILAATWSPFSLSLSLL